MPDRLALQLADSATPMAEIVRKKGLASSPFHRWKKKYSGMGPSGLRRFKQLEEENRKG